jgi:hypothetical protein
MASLEIQDLIGARNLAKSGMSLLSKVRPTKFMGLNIPKYLESYGDFIKPIHDNDIPLIDNNTPRLLLDVNQH